MHPVSVTIVLGERGEEREKGRGGGREKGGEGSVNEEGGFRWNSMERKTTTKQIYIYIYLKRSTTLKLSILHFDTRSVIRHIDNGEAATEALAAAPPAAEAEHSANPVLPGNRGPPASFSPPLDSCFAAYASNHCRIHCFACFGFVLSMSSSMSPNTPGRRCCWA